MSKSLPPVSAKVIADAEQFIAEFKRADNQARRSSDKINSEVDKLVKGVRKKFSASDIGKSVLSGFGLGSGFALAQTAVNAISGQWERAADYAKKVEDSTARQLANTTAAIKARMTDAQRETFLRREIEKSTRQLSQWQGSSQSFSIMEPGKWAENFRQFLNGTDKSELATEKINELTESLGALGTELEQLKKKKLDQRIAQNLAITTDLGSQVTRRGFAEMDLDEAINGPMGSEQRTKLINQLYKERAVYLEQISKIPFGSESNGARAIAEKNLADATTKLVPLMKEQVKLGFDIGNAMASSFETAILEAQNLRDVVNSLVRDIAQIAIRSAVTQPLGNWLGGMFTGMFGGGRATGGPVDAGTTYMVGEKGPELFTPSSGGNITPNHKLSGGRGDSYVFNYSIGAGVTMQQLMPALAMQKRDIIGTLSDAKRRRTPLGAAMA